MSDIIIEILPPAEINVVLGDTVPWADITDKPTSFTPSAHGSTHLPAGTDPIPGIVTEAPTDGQQYGRQSSAWTAIVNPAAKTQATITGNYTILSTDENIFVNTASAITISIPDALPLGKEFNIFRLIAGANITVDTVGSETINGAATYTFYGSAIATQVSFKKSASTDYTSSEAWAVPPVVKVTARKTASQAITANVTNVNFESEITDTNACWDGTTFTCPVSGWHRISLSGFSCSSSSGTFVPYIGGSAQNNYGFCTVTNANYFDGSTEIYLTVSQALTIRFNASLTVAPLATYGGRIDITRIGS